MTHPPEKRLVTEAALADALDEFAPSVPSVVKATATTKNNVATRSGDPELRLDVTAGTTYRLVADIYYTADIAADVSLSWSAPAGSAMTWCPDCFTSSASGGANPVNRGMLSSPTSNVTAGGTGVPATAKITGVFTAGEDGLLILTWAQATAHTSDVTVHPGSLLRLEALNG